MSFPELVLAGLIVAAGIYGLSEFNETAAWLLTFLVILTIALRYQKFADELSKILSLSSPSGNQATNGHFSITRVTD